METIPYVVGWSSAGDIIGKEAKQLVEEGRDPAWIRAILDQPRGQRSEADLWVQLQAAPQVQGYPFFEPNDLPGIRNARGPGSRQWTLDYTDDVLADRMLGAWLGRCCGCALGKPVEGFMNELNGLSSKDRIKTYLQAIGPDEYPLNNYIPLSSPAQEKAGAASCPMSSRERIAFMETDDDIRYTVLAQKIMLNEGAAFTTLDIMRTWIYQLPYGQVCTAETQAYRNYIVRYHARHGDEAEVDWDWIAHHQNPYREWIGAQIRADSWGYAAPGNPELAAEFAWRDARLSHVKNGIYGEMFVAAMIAAAFVLDDPLAVIEAGLAEIPQHSRLQRDIRQSIDLCRAHHFSPHAFEKVLDALYELLGDYNPVHTNNNAAVVAVALLLGGNDFEKAITIAVMGGWDTDCNGATVGSIFGAMHGAGKIPPKWTDPLHDTLYSEVAGYHPISITECARRSVKIAKAVRAV